MSITLTDQFKQGMHVEAFLDGYFIGRGYRVEPATTEQERIQCKGDRCLYLGERTHWIEYKSGIQTFYTGNVFLETISVDTTNKPGWVYTCQADAIVYAALLNKRLLFFRPATLREKIEDLKRRFPEVKTNKGQNNGYNTHGVIVPLSVAEAELAYNVIQF
jgi:hypothetical protein